jgi:hypothetical protein
MRTAAVFAGLVLLVGSTALAWSEAGHRIVASIAFRRLTAAERVKVVAILKGHPRYSEDFEGKMPANLDEATKEEWLFQQAALWPDLARSYSGQLSGQFHRPTWQYINVPHFLADADWAAMAKTLTVNLALDAPSTAEREMNVVQAISACRLYSHWRSSIRATRRGAWLMDRFPRFVTFFLETRIRAVKIVEVSSPPKCHHDPPANSRRTARRPPRRARRPRPRHRGRQACEGVHPRRAVEHGGPRVRRSEFAPHCPASSSSG